MSFSERDATAADGAADDALVYLEHVILDCPTDLSELLCPDVPISKVTIRRPTFRLTRRADGSWNAANLLPMPSCGKRQPEIIVEGGAIEIIDERKSPVSSFALRDVNLRLGLLEEVADVQNVASQEQGVASQEQGVARQEQGVARSEHSEGRECLQSNPPRPSLRSGACHTGETVAASRSNVRTVSGSLTGDHLRRIEFTGTFDPGVNNSRAADSQTGESVRAVWDIGGVIEGLELSPELCASLPSLGAERLRALGTFRGRGRFGFRLRSGDSDQRPLVFQLSGDVEEGRMDDPRLPYPLTNMRAAICCNNDGFSVKNLFAQSGQTTLHLSGKMAGFGKDAPWELVAQINKLKLEQSLTASLSAKLRAAWEKYSPSGQLRKVDMKLKSDLTGFRSDLAEISVVCGDVAFQLS